MRKFKDTEKLIYKMLTENTGKHILDSGGFYGRHWQENQRKSIDDFANESEEIYYFDKDSKDFSRRVSVFHYLTNNLELDYICNEFNELQNNHNNWDSDLYGVSKEAWEYLDAMFETEVKYSFNTYNGDSDLSQVLQGSYIDIYGEPYLIIQIHNGCDVRGGYTDAKLFKMEDEYMIHKYLQEYKDLDEIQEELNYIDELTDYWDESIKYTSEEVRELIEIK